MSSVRLGCRVRVLWVYHYYYYYYCIFILLLVVVVTGNILLVDARKVTKTVTTTERSNVVDNDGDDDSATTIKIIQNVLDTTDAMIQNYKQYIAKPMIQIDSGTSSSKKQQSNKNINSNNNSILLVQQQQQQKQHLQLLLNELRILEESFRNEYIHQYNIQQVQELQQYLTNVIFKKTNIMDDTTSTTTPTVTTNTTNTTMLPVGMNDSDYMSIQELEQLSLLQPETILKESESILMDWITSMIDDVLDDINLDNNIQLILQKQQQEQQMKTKGINVATSTSTTSTTTCEESITIDTIAKEVYTALVQYMYHHDSIFTALASTTTTTSNPSSSMMIDYTHSIVHQYTSPTYDPMTTTTKATTTTTTNGISTDKTLLSTVWWNKYIPQDWEDWFLPSNWQETFYIPKQLIPDHIYHTLGISGYLDSTTGYRRSTVTTNTAPPEAILQASILPGQCWPISMKQHSSSSSSPIVTIRLQQSIYVTGITIDHVVTSLLHNPQQQLQSAPKHINVYGYTSCNNKNCNGLGFDVSSKTLLTDTIIYSIDPKRSNVHTFPIRSTGLRRPSSMNDDKDTSCSAVTGSCKENEVEHQQETTAVSVEIIDNWGNEDYTCLYRIRVHGDPTQSLL